MCSGQGQNRRMPDVNKATEKNEARKGDGE